MSATLATEVYRQYFNLDEQAIFVGVRRFPIEVSSANSKSISYLNYLSQGVS
jgi:hypothetical protein